MKRGYTLIELVIVIALILILILPRFKLGNIYSNIANRVQVKSFINELTNTISYGKYHCRSSEKQGVIEINQMNTNVELKEINTGGRTKVLKSLVLPDGVKLLSTFTLQINKNGHIQSDSINIKDKEGNIYKITISTGVDTINVY